MPQTPFAHLHLHSEYSLLSATPRIPALVKAAVERTIPALAMTDRLGLFGMVNFYKEAVKKGVKPILGGELLLVGPGIPDPAPIVILAAGMKGYRHLLDLISRCYIEPASSTPTMHVEWLRGMEEVIVLTGGARGPVDRWLELGEQERATEVLRRLAAVVTPGNLYVELVRDGRRFEGQRVQGLVALAQELELPLVATNNVYFISPEDYESQQILECIRDKQALDYEQRRSEVTAEQWLKPMADMVALFDDLPEAIANAGRIARRCTVTIEMGKYHLPDFPTQGGVSIDEELRRQAFEGLDERWPLVLQLRRPVDPIILRAEYEARLEFELGTIIQMGFPGYFLIVADFIKEAKRRDIPVGPGRGSGAGSLVAYCISITDIDPLPYGLLFERFLNPERISMPDFDIDFCVDGRDAVIEYVAEKYGHANVGQIAAIGTMLARGVVKDVGRVLGMGFGELDRISKMIPFEIGMTLEKALESEEELRHQRQADERVDRLITLALRVEGLSRNISKHAAGVVIASHPLHHFAPLMKLEGEEGTLIQLDMKQAEAVGLVKFDFLGLRNLTVIHQAVKLENRLRCEQNLAPLDMATLPLDDPETYRLLQEGRTTGVFQLESGGMKNLLTKLKPDCFEDIIALVALYRPGPLNSGMVDQFVNRKHGLESVVYPVASLESILKETYGVMVYQEQVMQVAQIVAGYSLGEADLLRRAMGKKIKEEMAQQRDLFTSRAVERGLDEGTAGGLFDLMEKFAEYGFNKSHTAAYAVISYQTAWLKAHHTSAFMAATLSSELDNTDQLKVFYEDTLANKVKVLAPDVNVSGYRFEPVSRADIRYGLGAIKGTGEAAINVIVAAREKDGPFTSLFDFCRRVDKRTVNRRVIESLVRAGAFDTLNDNRASLLASVGVAMEAAEQENRDIFQNSLFDAMEDGGAESRPDAMVDAPRWPMIEQLTNEKKALGFYFSGHPYDAYRSELAGFIKTRLSDIVPQQQPVWLAGVIYAIRTQMTKRGKMAIISLEDGIARIEVSVFSELFDAHKDILKEDHTLILEGKISKDDYSGGFRVIAESLLDLAGARTRFAKLLRLSFPASGNPGQLKAEAHAESYAPQGDSDPLWAEAHAESYAGKLQEILSGYRDEAGCRVRIGYGNVTASCELELGEGWRVNLKDNLLVSLADCIGSENFIIQY